MVTNNSVNKSMYFCIRWTDWFCCFFCSTFCAKMFFYSIAIFKDKSSAWHAGNKRL